jgi:DNA-binding CsgD family transcriptional regulator
MIGIPEATLGILTMEERADLDRLARSRRSLRQRARIVLLAANGMASRTIGRAVGCTTGTVSKWRVRYAEKRPCGSRRNGRSGCRAEVYGGDVSDQVPPKGYAR